MEILVISGLLGVLCGIILPIIFFFRKSPSVAFGWMFLGFAVAGIGGCVGMADMAKQASIQMDKVIKEKSEEMRKVLKDTGDEFRKNLNKPKV